MTPPTPLHAKPSHSRHQRPTRLKQFLFGAPYYPEHWSAEDRAQDAERMASADVNVVRTGEFAWDLIESKRGRFDFSLFDETIARLAILASAIAQPAPLRNRAH